MTSIASLTDLMAALRHPENGCPWDIRQSSLSISSYTLEETYELLQAIQTGDIQNIKEELGDLLFHIVFHAQIASEQNQFNMDDVVQGIVDKMTHRHPHVFNPQADNQLDDETLGKQWKRLKSEDQKQKKPQRLLDQVDHNLPALIRAQKLQNAAADYYFDWPEVEPVLDKIEEEINELREAMQTDDSNHISAEMGDILFACTNLARHIGVDAESALRQTNEKFIRRFDYVFHQMQQAGIEFSPQQLEQMEQFWQQSKSVTG